MSAQAPTLARPRIWFDRGRTGIGRAADRIEKLPVPAVLAGFVAVEWASVLALARTVRHSGWIYYQGGDQLWYYSLGWLLSHGELGNTRVGYGWSVVLAPIARIAGPNLVSALPAIILFNVLVLLPVAMFALYGIAARIGGRLFGYWSVALWTAAPFIGILYTDMGYHQRYTELLLPQAFGLSALADFPTMVAALVSAYFCMRVLCDEEPRLLDALAAGAAAGAAIGIKPATTLFLLGPALAFAWRRRYAAAGVFAAGMAPALVTLAVWKQRGLGQLPLFGNASVPQRLAAGRFENHPVAVSGPGHYIHLDWSHFGNNLDLLREHFWSGRLLQWLVIAGLVGLARTSRTAFLLVGGWFAAFAIVKGAYPSASVEDGSVFRILMPAYPAFILLLASVPLLLPHAPRHLRSWTPAFDRPARRLRLIAVAAAITLSALVPLAAFAAARTTGGPAQVAQLSEPQPPIPANIDIGLTARLTHGRVALHWQDASPAGGPVFYRIWRGPATPGDGLTCAVSLPARSCIVALPEIAVVRTAVYVDKPGKGRWAYRVAVAANWLDDPAYGDPYLVSSPINVAVG